MMLLLNHLERVDNHFANAVSISPGLMALSMTAGRLELLLKGALWLLRCTLAHAS